MLLLEDFIHFEDNWGIISTIRYTLLQNEFNRKNIYGLKLEIINSKNIIESTEEILNVTDDVKFAKTIFYTLKKYLVTPTSLVNTLDDILSLEISELNYLEIY